MSDGITAQVYPVQRFGLSLSNVPAMEIEGLLGGLVSLRQGSYGHASGGYATGKELLDALITVMGKAIGVDPNDS